MRDVNDILSNNEELNDEQLMNYLNGNLSGSDLHDVEKQMADDAFVNDAVEGLQQFSSGKKLDEYVQQLNTQLQKQIAAPKERKEKRRLKDLPWIIQAVVIILLLCLMAYVVIIFVRSHG